MVTDKYIKIRIGVVKNAVLHSKNEESRDKRITELLNSIYNDGFNDCFNQERSKVWFVLEASMLTSESNVSLFGSEETARAEFEKRKAQYVKEMRESIGEETPNDDQYSEAKNSAWFSNEVLRNSETDIYLEVGSQKVRIK